MFMTLRHQYTRRDGVATFLNNIASRLSAFSGACSEIGHTLGSTLFNIFINDQPTYFDDSCVPTRIGNTPFNSMLYADDLMVISETQAGLQEAKYKLEKYCSSWSMKANTNKPKFMVTTCDRVQPCTVTYQQNNIEQMPLFKYLAIEVSKESTVSSIMNYLYRSGLKAYFKLMRSLKPLHKPSTLLNLFGHLIKPILLYGCEIWAPLDLKYRNPTRPLSEKASFTQDLRDQFSYITKYMWTEMIPQKCYISNCVSPLWGSTQKLPTWQYMQNWVVNHSSWTN